MNNLGKLQRAFVTALGIPDDADFPTLRYQGLPEWDSIAHMLLINEIEAAFDIMLPTDDVLAMSDFNQARVILARHGVDLDA